MDIVNDKLYLNVDESKMSQAEVLGLRDLQGSSSTVLFLQTMTRMLLLCESGAGIVDRKAPER